MTLHSAVSAKNIVSFLVEGGVFFFIFQLKSRQSVS